MLVRYLNHCKLWFALVQSSLLVALVAISFSNCAFAQIGSPDPARLMSRFDRDGDGALSKAEFAGFAEAISRFSGNPMDADALFPRLDRDNNGKIDATELPNARGGLEQAQAGPPEQPQRGMRFRRQRPATTPGASSEDFDPAMLRSLSLSALDEDKNGELSLQEFRKLGDSIPRLKADNVSGFLFSSLDANNDGTLDNAEFRTIFNYANAGPASDQPFNPIAGPVARNPLRSIVPNANEAKLDSVPASEQQLAFFSERILPLLESKCFGCHSASAETERGGLRLDSYEALRQGGSSGDFLNRDVEHNTLIMAVRGEGMPLMPPKQPLTKEQVKDLETWVTMGLPDARPRSALPKPESLPVSTIDLESGRHHWAYQPMQRRSAEVAADDNWSRTEIDRLLLAKMKASSLQPATDADRASLLRRLTLDLIGLPPTPDEVIAYLDDPRDDQIVFAEAVERLLNSKHFGEHWGRHWLDVARFAESSGKDVNIFYPFAWRYRDYVIDAFNADKPYDQFLIEQIAGDLVPSKNANDKAEKLVATGYLAIGPKAHSETDARQFLLDVADEQVDAISRGMLGITISCARCHDHKFDPISQLDYHALAGIFASTETLFGGARTVQTNRTTGLLELPPGADVPVGESLSPGERKSLEQQLSMMKRMGGGGMNPITLIRSTNVKAKLSHYDQNGKPLKLAMSVRDGQPIDIPVFLRGELNRPSQTAARSFPQVIEGPKNETIREGSGRLELAHWLTDPAHPLTARVMANRVWQHLFGVGIVSTPDNFGTTGNPPSHPELLDHLALSLIDQDWSIKSLIRQIVSSRAYQMGTDANAHQLQIDPDNVLVWRQTRRRLPAESIRDSILLASGSLDPVPPIGSPVTRFGDGQARVLDRDGSAMAQLGGGMLGGGMFGGGRLGAGMMEGMMGNAPSLETKPNTRSVYIPIIRDRIDSTLDAFDFPDASMVTGKRDTTTVASQSLYLMNSDFVMKQADIMANNVMRSAQSTEQRIELAFLRSLSRRPRTDELAMAKRFLESGDKDPKAWSQLCQSLFATAEFRHTR